MPWRPGPTCTSRTGTPAKARSTASYGPLRAPKRSNYWLPSTRCSQPADFQPSQGSNNCVLVVAENAAAGRPVDLVELEYEERRRVTQFAVRSVNDDGSYRHSGLTFLPVGALDLAALVGFLRQLEADGQHEALPLTQARLRTRSTDDVLQDIAGMNLDDLFDRFLFEGRLTAIKA